MPKMPQRMLPNFRDVEIDKKRWPHIAASELACFETVFDRAGRASRVPCSHCGGEYYHDAPFLDKLQAARFEVGKPFIYNSGHRCAWSNVRVGGALYSSHRKIAGDISTRGHDRRVLLKALRNAGLTTFGFYENFIHTDPRHGRIWFVSGKARRLWLPYLT